MNIMFIVAVYPPEGEPTAVMAKQIADNLAADRQHSVTVVCPFPNRPHGEIFPGYKRKWKSTTNEDSVRVMRIWTWLIGRKRSFLNRLLENLSFGLTSSLNVLGNRPDLILLETWPIFAQLPVMFFAKLLNIPVINYIKDIYPEVAIAAGMMSDDSLTAKMFKSIDTWICKHSWRNLVISNTMYDHFVNNRKIDASKVQILWDWLDLTFIHPVQVDDRWRKEVGLNHSDFVCMFSGTMGHASGADTLVDVADLLRKHANIKIVCIGEGVLKDRIVSEKNKRTLDNLIVLPFQPRERVCEVQSSSDVLLLTASATMGTSSVPSKFITYIAIGKPVICGAGPNSDLSELVNSEKLGISVLPGSAELMANAIQKIMQIDRRERLEMGQRARAVALNKYSMDTAIKQLTLLINEAE
ncbi:MAG: glycosyltransferase family 4 protein [Planctomycetota bacterium]|jgi:colanic acid biosynthesis glycosyl transferase WcaI